MIKKILIFLIFSFFFSPISFAKEAFFKNESTITNKENGKISPQKRLGIEIISLRLTAYGKLIDFRYKVIDDKRASIIFNPKLQPYLVDTKTNNKFYVPNTPKIGALRSYGTPVKNRVYFMLFGNNGLLKKGSKVNIVIGDVTIEDLMIE